MHNVNTSVYEEVKESSQNVSIISINHENLPYWKIMANITKS